MESGAEAVLCTRCGIHPPNTKKNVLKGLCCNKCPNHGPWCTMHMAHDCEGDAKCKEAKVVVKKQPAAPRPRRDSVKPQKLPAGSPKRDPIEAALHRVEMEYDLKTRLEKRQEDKRKKDDVKAQAEVDQYLKQRKHARRSLAKAPNVKPASHDHDEDKEAAAFWTNMDDLFTPAKAGQDEVLVPAEEEVPAEAVVDAEILVAHAEVHEDASPEKAEFTSCDAEEKTFPLESPEPEPLLESPLLQKPSQKEESKSEMAARGQAALQVAKTLFQELVFEKLGAEAENLKDKRKKDLKQEPSEIGLQKEPSEVEEMLRNRKSARLSHSMANTPKKHLAFDDDDGDIAQTVQPVRSESARGAVEVSDFVGEPSEETEGERRMRGEAALQMARLLTKELDDERKQIEKRKRNEEKLKRDELQAGLAERLRNNTSEAAPVLAEQAGLAEMPRKRKSGTSMRKSLGKALKMRQEAVNENAVSSPLAEQIEPSSSKAVDAYPSAWVTHQSHFPQPKEPACDPEEEAGNEVSSTSAEAAEAHTDEAEAAEADTDDVDARGLPEELIPESDGCDKLAGLPADIVRASSATDINAVSAAKKRRSGEGVRRRRSGEAALRMADLLVKELAEERQQHDKRKRGDAKGQHVRVEKVRRTQKEPAAAKKPKRNRQVFSDDDSPVPSQDKMDSDSPRAEFASLVTDGPEIIAEPEASCKVRVSLGNTPPFKTKTSSVAAEASEKRSAERFSSPEDLLFALIAKNCSA